MLKEGEPPRPRRKVPTSEPSFEPLPAVPTAGPPAKIGADAQYTAATLVPDCSTGPPWYVMPVLPPGRLAAFLYASSCAASFVSMMWPWTASLLELLSDAASGTASDGGESGLLGESVQAAR